MFKHYIVRWTDIYNSEHKNTVKAISKAYAERAIPSGDILKRIDSVEEVFWNEELQEFIAKPKPFADSKVPVMQGANLNFGEYGHSVVPNQGEIFDFETAHAIAVKSIAGIS